MRKNETVKIGILLAVDVISILVAYLLTYMFKYGVSEGVVKYNEGINLMPFIIMMYIIPLMALKMYKSVWTIAGIDEGIKGFGASFIGGGVAFVFATLIDGISPMITIGGGVLIFILIVSSRLSIRVARRILLYGEMQKESGFERVLVVGAGACGMIVITEMIKNPEMKMKPVCLVDDNKLKSGKYIKGIKVEGTRRAIKNLVDSQNITTIIIAIANLDRQNKKEIIEICQKTKANIKIVPGITEIIDGTVSLKQIKSIDLKDLLGRDEVKLDKTQVEEYIKGKKILVTGGGGSIGSELCRQIASFNPDKLYILDIYENNAYDLQNELKIKYPNLNQRVLIASVRDSKRINKIFKEEDIDVVFHAAAHKHVPLMEDNPEEAIKNNVMGTYNVAKAASTFNVDRFVLISTDKAVNPTNIMGATKRLCEMIVQGMNKESKTEYVAVRFGNVLGSNGSVIPLFKRQIKTGGPVTLTHENIIRYFMLIPEAAQLVLQAGAFAKGGEIFVLDMGEPIRIYDLAEKLIKLSGFTPHEDIEIKITGLRPGEKLYEELLMNEEGLEKTEHEKIFIGAPSDIDIDKLKREIDELLDVAINEEKLALKRKMRTIVKTYIEPEIANEVAIGK